MRLMTRLRRAWRDGRRTVMIRRLRAWRSLAEPVRCIPGTRLPDLAFIQFVRFRPGGLVEIRNSYGQHHIVAIDLTAKYAGCRRPLSIRARLFGFR